MQLASCIAVNDYSWAPSSDSFDFIFFFTDDFVGVNILTAKDQQNGRIHILSKKFPGYVVTKPNKGFEKIFVILLSEHQLNQKQLLISI